MRVEIMHNKHFIMYAIRIATCCVQNSTQKRQKEKKRKNERIERVRALRRIQK